MAQAGDFQHGNGTGGESIWGGQFNDEISPKLHHLHGALAKANSGPNTNGSQFYIVQNATGAGFLDGGYTIFGQAFEGLDVVDLEPSRHLAIHAQIPSRMRCLERPV